MPVRVAPMPSVLIIQASIPSAEVPDIRPITVRGARSEVCVILSMVCSYSGFAVYRQSVSVGA